MLTKTVLGLRPGKWTDVGRGKSLASKRCPKATADSYCTAHGQHVSVIVWLLLGETQTKSQMGRMGRGAEEERTTGKGGE